MYGASMPLAKSRRPLGDFGESLAAAYLVRNGYCILERQWRCSAGELDLVARLGDQVVFVEVRTRRAATDGVAEESITPAKQKRLIALAYTYLANQNFDDTICWRIDIITVAVDAAGRLRELNHIPYAVEGEN